MSDQRYEEDMTLARALEEHMDAQKLNQELAARRIGVSQPTLSKWLAGQAPSRVSFPKVAAFIGVDEVEIAAMVQRGYSASRSDRLAELETRVDEITEWMVKVERLLKRKGSKP